MLQEMKKVIYPFVPKSNSSLVPGHFWAIPLASGRYGCGRVIQLPTKKAIGSTRSFLAGLMDWIGDRSPTGEAIAGSKTLTQGEVHLKTILCTGGTVLGWRALDDDGIEPDLFCSQSEWSGCVLKRGLHDLRPISMDEFKHYPVFSAWGYMVIHHHAENLAQDPERTRKYCRDHSDGKTGGPFPRLGE
jgi:hypothetical protein